MKNNSATINAPHTAEHAGGKPTVLIVDDSKVIRLALNKILKEDFEVIQANDGEEALACLDENPAISSVFSDVSMPGLDGFGLLERVRASSDARIANLPFIIITANDDSPDFSDKVKTAGGNDLVTKPFKTNEIKACISKHGLLEQLGTVGSPGQDPVQEDIPVLEPQIIQEASKPEVDNGFDTAAILGLEIDDVAPTAQEEPEQLDANTADTGIEFIVNEDFFNEAAIEHADSHDIPAVDGTDGLPNMDDFLSDIDETLLMPDLDIESELDATNGQEEVPVSAELHLEEASLSLDDNALSLEPQAEEPAFDMSDELSLDIDFETDESSVPELTDAISEVAEAPSKKMELEQARKRAMDIAREKAEAEVEVTETPEFESAAEQARRSTERDQIREQLQRMREREVVDQTYQKDLDHSVSGSISSFFAKLGRIIKGLFGIK